MELGNFLTIPGSLTMNKETLHTKLEELRSQLAAVSALDEKTHDRLRSLVADIERAIEHRGDSNQPGELLSEQVDDLVLKFEAEHPQLTSALNQVAAALANLGI
jgi:chromosome segregation ATPase